ncbi:MAG: hypothetical protein K2W95_27940 [Candidatus Obscuribacterales bacterium]|nr:hypothetical protein [Candidatus Obscuribacterales bacterium]
MITRTHEQNFQQQKETMVRRLRMTAEPETRLAKIKFLRAQAVRHPEESTWFEHVKATLHTAYCQLRSMFES